MRGFELCTRAPALPWWDGCSWIRCEISLDTSTEIHADLVLRMLGSLTVYRRILREHVFAPTLLNGRPDPSYKLPSVGHGMAGMLAGFTVSFIAGPVEHIKARLQVQYAADKSKRLYSGPIDCTKKIVGRAPPSPTSRTRY